MSHSDAQPAEEEEASLSIQEQEASTASQIPSSEAPPSHKDAVATSRSTGDANDERSQQDDSTATNAPEECLTVETAPNKADICLTEAAWSTEQDAAPMEQLIGNGIMSPIAFRRDSFECWSAEQNMVVTQEVEDHLEAQDSMFVGDVHVMADDQDENAKSSKSLERTNDRGEDDTSTDNNGDLCGDGQVDHDGNAIDDEGQLEANLSLQSASKIQSGTSSTRSAHGATDNDASGDQVDGSSFNGEATNSEEDTTADLSQRSLSTIRNDSAGSALDVAVDMDFGSTENTVNTSSLKGTAIDDEGQELAELSRRSFSSTLRDSNGSARSAVDISFAEKKVDAASQDEGAIDDEEQPAVDLSQRSVSRILNDSAGSAYSVDIDSAKKKVGASSHAFLEHLRGAANRRKNQVIRSRDSLMAKQKHLKETTNAAVVAVETSREEAHSLISEKKVNPFKLFKALPMPPTSGGGLVGVPKVSKKPSTTPFSPLLGARRQSKVTVASLRSRPSSMARLDAVKRSNLIPPRSEESLQPFKARPLPTDQGCQGGIPKVSKRPTTVPLSPLLGVRRQDTHSRGSVSNSETSISLVGLNLLASPAVENIPPARVNTTTMTPVNQRISRNGKAYVPHSTVRAKERAKYDRQRSSNEDVRLKHTKRGWVQEIRRKKAEIAKLLEKI